MLSFVIPAHNEEAVLGATLDALDEAATALGAAFEVIVVADACTDGTAEVARSRGARVVAVELRKISAVRNAGAKVARGDAFVFVDADTLVPESTLAATVAVLGRGVIGGGARVAIDDDVPSWARIATIPLLRAFYQLQLAGGCYLFARRDAFARVRGFDERYFASEEIHMCRALKALGRFVVVSPPVVTSGRKLRMYTPRQLLGQLSQLAVMGIAGLRRRESLPLWYGGQREQIGRGLPD